MALGNMTKRLRLVNTDFHVHRENPVDKRSAYALGDEDRKQSREYESIQFDKYVPELEADTGQTLKQLVIEAGSRSSHYVKRWRDNNWIPMHWYWGAWGKYYHDHELPGLLARLDQLEEENEQLRNSLGQRADEKKAAAQKEPPLVTKINPNEGASTKASARAKEHLKRLGRSA